MKKRALIVSGLAALAALFLAPIAEASLTRATSSAMDLRAPALTLASPAPEPSEFSLFEGQELTAAAAESERASSFHPLAAVSLLSKNGAEASLVSADELIYPKTRYRVFGLLGTPILGVERGVSLELRWGCASFSCGLASGTVGWLSQDPLEDRDSPNLYGFVGARPHELTDPLGLAVVPRNPTAGQWADLQEAAPELRRDRPDAVPSGGGASIGSAFRRHSAEIGTVVGGMAVKAATEAVIYYTEGKVAELGIRIVLKVGGRLTTKFARTIQEAVNVARDEGSSNIRYVQERGAAAPSLSASGTRFEAATSGARDVRFYPSDQSYRAPNGTFVSPRGVPSPGTTRAREFADFLKSKEMNVVGIEMEVEGPAGTRRYDLVVRDAQGALHGIEVKTGTATKDAYQDFTDFFVNRFGATGRGRISGERVTSVTTVFLP